MGTEDFGGPRIRKAVDLQIDIPYQLFVQEKVAHRAADRQHIARAPFFEQDDNPPGDRSKEVGTHRFFLSEV